MTSCLFSDSRDKRLLKAAKSGRPGAFLALFSQGLGPNSETSSGQTALRAALTFNQWSLVDWLIEKKGARLPETVRPWLVSWVQQKNLPALKWMAEKEVSFYEALRQDEHVCPLMIAVLIQDREAVPMFNAFMAWGVPADPSDPRHTSWLEACFGNKRSAYYEQNIRIPFIEAALAAGVSPNRMRRKGCGEYEPVFHHAILQTEYSSQAPLLERFLAAGADPFLKNNRGQSFWEVWSSVKPFDENHRSKVHMFKLKHVLTSAPSSRAHSREIRLRPRL